MSPVFTKGKQMGNSDTGVQSKPVSFGHENFSAIQGKLFTLLSAYKETMTQVVITPTTLTYTQLPEHGDLVIGVMVEVPFDRYELIAFLVSPGMTWFGPEWWLNDQLDTYPTELHLFKVDEYPSVDFNKSK